MEGEGRRGKEGEKIVGLVFLDHRTAGAVPMAGPILDGIGVSGRFQAAGDQNAPVNDGRSRPFGDESLEAGIEQPMGDKWSPQIAVGTSVMIPETYVPDLAVRLGLYRRLADLENEADIESAAAELVDRFGKLPPEVETLPRVREPAPWGRRTGRTRRRQGRKKPTRR